LTAVAVNTNGVLKRLPVYDVPLFNTRKLLAPALSSVYIDHAFERGTFGTWVAQRAVSLDGLSVIIGRNHDPQYPDRLYLVVRMPSEARTYKVVLGWKDREEFRQDGSGDDAGERDG
jgi:hypothetical protein